jgi:hypothetical protein
MFRPNTPMDRCLERLGKAPLLSLGMRLGEGSGAALAIQVLKGALACHSGMATFAEAGVSEGLARVGMLAARSIPCGAARAAPRHRRADASRSGASSSASSLREKRGFEVVVQLPRPGDM